MKHQPEGFDAGRTERMAARKLRFLRIFGGQLVSNAIEQLDVALLWVLLQRRDKSPRHSASGLSGDGGVGPTSKQVSSLSDRCVCMPRFQGKM